MPSISAPIESVPKISRRIVPALKRLGIKTIRDLLFHFPSRYEDFSDARKINEVAAGETVTIEGEVMRVTAGRTLRKRMTLLQAVIRDETGRITATWFNQPFLARTIREGLLIRLSGKVAQGPRGICLQNPAYERITNRESRIENQGIHTGGLIPMYPETQGITSRWLRFLVKSFIELRHTIPDPLPDETRSRHSLPGIAEAVGTLHFPQTRPEATAAERRFMFQDLLLLQLRSLRERSRLKQSRSPAISADVALIKRFVDSLPYSLTDGQRRSIWEIAKDMEKPHPMNRLLEGDVGSGKTVVAAAAALLAVRAGHRVAFMTPTEILARQHFATLSKALTPLAITIGLVVGADKKKRPTDGDIVVGTHALIQKNVRVENLGLVVVDEQHRFGVNQRSVLAGRDTSLIPHFLSMTATPIPRTLALTIYGDLDLSLLDEMPKSRKPVITRIVPPQERSAAYGLIREEIRKGRQAFVICPRIEPPDESSKFKVQSSKRYQQQLLLAEVKTVAEEHKKLSEEIFPDLRVGVLHGKMKSKEKDVVMKKFRDREFDILVSTSVIEVGVDIPNAAVMLIEGAERFGLAQLHQFRGRVGRGGEQSYCFLFPTEDGMAARRLRALAEAKNGFALAEEDLKIRGPGELFGTRQSGASDLVLKGITDPELVRAVRQEALALVKASPDLMRFAPLRVRLEELEHSLHLE